MNQEEARVESGGLHSSDYWQTKNGRIRIGLMRRYLAALTLLITGAYVCADSLLPTEDGTEWEYKSTELLTGEPPKQSVVVVRSSKESFEGKELLKLETLSDEIVTKAELIQADDGGLTCLARLGRDGKIVKLEHPETMVPPSLKVGMRWDQKGEVEGVRLLQHWEVVGLEPVTVPAKQFLAYHFHCEGSGLISAVIDRWFVLGTGMVKEITVVKVPGALHRVTLELQKITFGGTKPEPKPASPSPRQELPSSPVPVESPGPAPAATAGLPASEPNEIKSGTPAKLLTVEVSSDPEGGLKTEFGSDVSNIYVRWHGHGLPENATVRVAWIAEDVGDLVEPNFIVDETETAASAPDASARFTLSRPPDGWAEGKYRVEFYVNDALTETVKVTIGK